MDEIVEEFENSETGLTDQFIHLPLDILEQLIIDSLMQEPFDLNIGFNQHCGRLHIYGWSLSGVKWHKNFRSWFFYAPIEEENDSENEQNDSESEVNESEEGKDTETN